MKILLILFGRFQFHNIINFFFFTSTLNIEIEIKLMKFGSPSAYHYLQNDAAKVP